jgi:hypothetical protein
VKHFVISEDELEEIFHKGRPRSEKAWNDMLSIRAKITQSAGLSAPAPIRPNMKSL